MTTPTPNSDRRLAYPVQERGLTDPPRHPSTPPAGRGPTVSQSHSEPAADPAAPAHAHQEAHSEHTGHRGHGLMMLLCCIPMVVVVVALIATGVAGSGALLWVLACVAIMAFMHRAMPGGHDHR